MNLKKHSSRKDVQWRNLSKCAGLYPDGELASQLGFEVLRFLVVRIVHFHKLNQPKEIDYETDSITRYDTFCYIDPFNSRICR